MMIGKTAIQFIFKPFVFGLLFLTFSCAKDKEEKYQTLEKSPAVFYAATDTIPDHAYVGDKACQKCHADAYETWKGSHHDLSMQEAKRSTILADFKGEVFRSQGVTSKFFERDGAFFANTEGPDGKNHDYKIIYVFGVTPLQQYIVQFPNGHYQCLRTAWDVNKKTWYDLYPDFKVVHSEWLHWSRGGLNWNTMCADCHSTNVQKNYDFKTHSFNTHYSIINVSCEACHGPAKKHVEHANKLGKAYKSDGSLKMTPGIQPQELVDECGRCHMRREQISTHFNHEGNVYDHYFPQLIANGIYHEDGQILDEDYVYGSFIQSKMYHNNVTCTNCHNPHSLKLKFEGNKLCAQCHEPSIYNQKTHHFHKMGTASAQCVNCHMVGKHYMGIDFRRDHSFRIPRPDQSVAYGTPNACNNCHDDKEAKWAADAVKNWYPHSEKKHFSDLLIPGMQGKSNGMEKLLRLLKDTSYPAISRASAVQQLSQYEVNPKTMLSYLNDKEVLVRSAVAQFFNETQHVSYLKNLLPLLKDDSRSVRVKTFQALAALPIKDIDEKHLPFYKNAAKEFFAQLDATADFVGGRVNKGNFYLKKGKIDKAIDYHLAALKIDPLNNIVRSNLANIYYQNRQFKKAVDNFKIIIEQEPDFGPTYYSLGLLYAEQGNTSDAIKNLEIATRKLSDNPRIYYNLGLLYSKEGKPDLAEKSYLRGLDKIPNQEDLLYVLAYHYNQVNKKEKAVQVAQTLIALFPQKNQYKDFLTSLKQGY